MPLFFSFRRLPDLHREALDRVVFPIEREMDVLSIGNASPFRTRTRAWRTRSKGMRKATSALARAATKTMEGTSPSESAELEAEIDAIFAEQAREEQLREEEERRKKERKRPRQERERSTPSTRPRKEKDVQGNLMDLPADAILCVLKYLSAEDLLQLASCSRFLREKATEDSLWRRLYGLRWKALTREERSAVHSQGSWMKRYRSRDAAEARHAMEGASDAVRGYYMDMHMAKRSVAPSRAWDDMSELALVYPTFAEVVDTYRKEKGLLDVEGKHTHHVCSGNTCTFHKVGDAFVCEQTGRVHVCDETCRERIVDPTSELLVCSISGRCFDRWVSQEEEDRMNQDRAFRYAEVEQGDEVGATTGRLGRAYQAGYGCDTEQELYLHCGVKLR